MTLRFCSPSPPSPLLSLPHPRLIFSTYNPHTPTVPSRYASDTALNPPYTSSLRLCSALLTFLQYWPNPQCRLPSLGSCSALNMRLQWCPHLYHHHFLCFRTHG
ncbi:hypothetical protein O181_019757 [Austropuccinia psidii MF-1]|uniref:Uncharacterized protein n=1 Tax=Austropuccinia psidii MF-1 TaxID=1389203 RepID=A0A9Q3GUQ7_9BASI|nr:hypothetical protein [Austropuccinia psidii MF-1]